MPTHYAIITGSASGLGRALAVRLARDGWHLALADLDDPANAETFELVTRAGGTGQIEQLDVANIEQWQSLAARLQQAWPRLDLLVNNAGVAVSGAVGEVSLDDWRWLLSVNLWGVIHGCHVCLPWLKANPAGGHVINVASLAGLIAVPNMATYSVAKFGVVALSESMYAELRSSRIGVTVVCPGFFRTNLGRLARFSRDSHREFFDSITERSRFTADDVADATITAMRRKRLYVVVAGRARVLWRLKRGMPRTIARLLAWLHARRNTDDH